MQTKAGIPSTIKKINESFIREKFMFREPKTCAQVVAETGISVTTVRAIMNEMLKRNELRSLGLLESSGGRRSEQFIINDDCYEGISICMTDDFLYVSKMNIHARITEQTKIPSDFKQNLVQTLIKIIEERINERTRAIGLGVPGVVSATGFSQNFFRDTNEDIDIVTALKQKFALPIILENDLNASALGFAKAANIDSTLAFIHFISSCNYIAAGFVDGNKIIRGMGNFAGELGLMPYDIRQDFSEALFSADELRRSEIIARLVSWVCCTINPQQIVLCCNTDFKINARKISKMLAYHLPEKMLPKLVICSGYEQYFMEGMALLTCTHFY